MWNSVIHVTQRGAEAERTARIGLSGATLDERASTGRAADPYLF